MRILGVNDGGVSFPSEVVGARRSPESTVPVLIVSAFTVILNETIMSVAIPHLIDDLGITAVDAQWLTTAFLLTMAVVIPITGFLLERFHTRPVFLAAMGLFSVGTLALTGIATTTLAALTLCPALVRIFRPVAGA